MRVMQFWYLVGLFLASANLAAADSLLQISGPAKLLTSAEQENGVVLLAYSGMLELSVEVSGGDALEVRPPETWTASPGWKIKEVSRATNKHRETGWRWRQTITLDPLAPGSQTLQLEKLRYRDTPDGAWQAISFKPLTVKITPQIHEGDLQKLREQTPIEELPPPPEPIPWWPFMLAGLGVLGLGLVWFVLRRRWVGKAPSRTPREIALYELARLKALDLPGKGHGEAFHTLLANIVRRYLEKEYHLPARRKTTQEFAKLLAETPRLPVEQKERLCRFLERCDLGKFAGTSMSVQDCDSLERQARELLSGAGHVQKETS